MNSTRINIFFMLGFLSIFCSPGASVAATFYVDSSCVDPPHTNVERTISQAVDKASPGDDIVIYSGQYMERLSINKPMVLSSEGGTATIGQYFPAEEELAFHWAPIHYQDVDKNEDWNGRADYITSIDRSGTWDVSRNWFPSEGGTFGSYPLEAWVYYSVVSTTSHHFIIYAFYHPMDTSWIDENNDLESALFIIRRDGSTWGTLEAVKTVWHTYFHSYFPAGSPLELNCGYENQGVCTVQWRDGRVMTSQEALGHGLGLYPAYVNEGDDAVVYIPSRTEAGVPPDIIPDGTHVEVPYRLVDIHAPGGMWEHRYDTRVFDPATNFLGFVGGHGNPPWSWEHSFWTHEPAVLAQKYFKLSAGTPAPEDYFIRNYTRNPYLTDMDIVVADKKVQICDPLLSLSRILTVYGETCDQNHPSYPCDQAP
jgi:hypothetical protein